MTGKKPQHSEKLRVNSDWAPDEKLGDAVIFHAVVTVCRETSALSEGYTGQTKRANAFFLSFKRGLMANIKIKQIRAPSRAIFRLCNRTEQQATEIIIEACYQNSSSITGTYSVVLRTTGPVRSSSNGVCVFCGRQMKPQTEPTMPCTLRPRHAETIPGRQLQQIPENISPHTLRTPLSAESPGTSRGGRRWAGSTRTEWPLLDTHTAARDTAPAGSDASRPCNRK